MEIKYLAHSSFLIKTKDAKVVMDPFDPKFVGLKFSKQEADVVTISHAHKDHSFTELIEGTPLILTWPGQFEKKGVRIWGFSSFHDKVEGKERGENVMYKIESEGVSILHCGDLGAIPSDAQIDEIGDVNILLVPVGGKYALTAEEAIHLIKKVEPAIVIPMHYGRPDLAIEGLAPLEDFLKKMGGEQIEPLDKLVVKREDFAVDAAMKVVLLK
ncbi:MAG: MBL fold metallo-hydrolase [Candidatus Roizmanbacteria bacterium]|nr:MBL fold metallo-hydrolase [Candidatus Roizmanbacteria bacterium]